jgi:hypothetical protein
MNILNCRGEPMDAAHNPLTLADGLEAIHYVCLPLDMEDGYTLTVGGGSWHQEISWNITNVASGDRWHGGGSPYFYSSCPTPSPTVCSKNIYTVYMHDEFGDGASSRTFQEKNAISDTSCDSASRTLMGSSFLSPSSPGLHKGGGRRRILDRPAPHKCSQGGTTTR